MAAAALIRVWSQFGGAGEQLDLRPVGTALACPMCRFHQGASRCFVGRDGCQRQMPRVALDVVVWVEYLGEDGVRLPASFRVGTAVARGSDEGVPEGDELAVHGEQGSGFRVIERLEVNTKLSRGSLQQLPVSPLIRRQDQQQRSGLRRQACELIDESRLDEARYRERSRLNTPTIELIHSVGLGELVQDERISSRFDRDPRRNRAFQAVGVQLVQQEPSVVSRQPAHPQFVEAAKCIDPTEVPDGEDHCDAIGEEPSGHECQRIECLEVEPMRVVDDAQYWRLRCRIGEECQGGQPDVEAVRPRAVDQTERRVQRRPLRGGKRVGLRQQRVEESL